MRPFWHPLSTIMLAEPTCFASPIVVRMMLSAQPEIGLVYAGDRMWPAVPHGSPIRLRALDRATIKEGDVVLSCADGVPDLLRVAGSDADRVRLAADADPRAPAATTWDSLIACAVLPRRSRSGAGRAGRRLRIDLREAWACSPDAIADPADSVRDKYDSQATFYARSNAAELERGLSERIRELVPAGREILVLGSGSGKECFALAASGWRVTGLDFAPAMVAVARSEAERRELDVEFIAADVRRHELPRATFSAILFTYDVYSFVPRRAERVGLLRRIRQWLRDDGVVFLSARTLHSQYDRWILGVQRLAGRLRASEPGDSHTRWISMNGALRRSYIHYFTDARLESEIVEGGFRLDGWRDAHGVLRPTGLL